ncbi:MAG: hypothetical protein EBT92_08790 [Planctomycetes bacterium]|nr:hypothetical protein [Planctomycetota bacterium]
MDPNKDKIDPAGKLLCHRSKIDFIHNRKGKLTHPSQALLTLTHIFFRSLKSKQRPAKKKIRDKIKSHLLVAAAMV